MRSGDTEERRRRRFQGNNYCLPLGNDSVDCIVAYSSFDSLYFLDRAVKEVARVLRPGGAFLLFQDVCTDLYAPRNGQVSNDSVEHYHQHLLDVVRRSGAFQIRAGGSEGAMLEEVVIEPINAVKERLHFVDRRFSCPLLLSNIGEGKYNLDLEPAEREGMRQAYASMYKPSKDFSACAVSDEQAIQWVRLRYLVVERMQY